MPKTLAEFSALKNRLQRGYDVCVTGFAMFARKRTTAYSVGHYSGFECYKARERLMGPLVGGCLDQHSRSSDTIEVCISLYLASHIFSKLETLSENLRSTH